LNHSFVSSLLQLRQLRIAVEGLLDGVVSYDEAGPAFWESEPKEYNWDVAAMALLRSLSNPSK
jgi:hypothetical protein